MIGIVDYGAGNIGSMVNALDRLGAPSIVSGSAGDLESCSGLILPGVGAAASAMSLLDRNGLAGWLRGVSVPLLGICLGAQLLFERSEEGACDCLGIIPGDVARLAGDGVKIPHVGWNRVRSLRPDPLFEGIADGSYFYFVHAYAIPVVAATSCVAVHGEEFSAAVSSGSGGYRGVQFHPEKSGEAGLRLLANFLKLC
jgi:glutamine amidotransferase